MGDAGYWEARYQEDNDPWDIGQPSPGLVAWLAAHPDARGKALVVGCGPGHDAVAIARHGFDVTAIDFAPTAVAETLQRAKEAGVELKALEADIFALPKDVRGAAYVFEHTCFCAIDRARRPGYVEAMADVLAPGGQLVGVFFTFPDAGKPGPPFTSTPEELRTLFSRRFEVTTLEPETHSIERRRNEEHLGVFTLRADLQEENARLRAEVERLRRSQDEDRALFSSIIHHAPTTITFLDRDLVYRLVNPTWSAQTGLEAEAVLGRTVPEIFPQAGEAMVELLQGLLAEGGTRHFPAQLVPLREADGLRDAYWDVDYIAIPGPDGWPLGVLVMGQEVTHVVEREARDRATIEALQQADRLKDEFLSTVSHELRTPVHVLLGYMHLLLRVMASPLTADQRSVVEKARLRAEGLGALVDAVLDFNQLRAGTFRLDLEPVEPPKFLAEALEPLGDLARRKGVALRLADVPDLPPAQLDPLRVGQVLTNVVGNAIKFTPEGGQVEVRAAVAAGRLRVEVQDDGVGIAEAHHDTVFEHFKQVDMGLTRKAGGVGLGLAIAKQLVEAHAGAIGFTSREGQGSTFWFDLPLDGPHA